MFCIYSSILISLNSQHLDNLLQQLPSPYILLGDFNGHNILWVVKTMIPEVNLSKILLQRMIFVLRMISLILIILQVQSLLHLLIFPSVIHRCFLIIIGLYVKTNTIVITSLSSLNRSLFPLRITIQSGN